jgi:hypothetical protein
MAKTFPKISLGLSTIFPFPSSVPAIRCKYGTKPLHTPSPGFPLLSGSHSAEYLSSSLPPLIYIATKQLLT